MKNILLFLVIIYCSTSCTNEKIETPYFFNEKFASEPYIEHPLEASCIPFIPIEIDTSVKWLAFPINPYQGRQEYGWARAEVKHNGYKWNASASAIDHGNEVWMTLQTFKSEIDDHAFVEMINFKVLKDVDRCSNLVARSVASLSKTTSTTSYIIGDWDVLYYSYLPDQNYVGVLEIIEFDTINNRMKGRFDLQVVIDHPSGYEEIPDTIHFANGVFECDIL